MLSIVKSCGLQGIDGYIVEVETDVAKGFPGFEIVGLPDSAIRESKERVKAAIKNTGYEFPVKKITINLAPANTKKEGAGFDLPIAITIIHATEQFKCTNIDEYIFVGEVSLNGEIRPVKGILPMVICAKEQGVKKIIVSQDNADEASIVQGIEVYGANYLIDVINHLTGERIIERYYKDINDLFENDSKYQDDFADVKGQYNVKRALEVAAAGGHNCLVL